MKRIAAILLAVIMILGVLPCKENVWAASEEAALQPCEIIANVDQTVTLFVVIDGNIRGFDFGVAFSLAEATPVSYGFTDEFLEACGEQNGTAIDHYFEDGERVSGDDRYFVFGGMANSGAAYSGRMAYVTFALTGAQASVSVIKESAAYASATEIREKGTVYTLVPGTGSGQNGTDPGAGNGQNGTDPGTGNGQNGTDPGANDNSGGQGTDGADDVQGGKSADQTNGKASAAAGSTNAAKGKTSATENSTDAGSRGTSGGRTKTGDSAHTAGYCLLILLSLLLEICCSFVLKHHSIDAIM